MALYFAGSKQKLNLGGAAYSMNLIATLLDTNNMLLLTSDGYVLRDCNSVILTVKEDE